MDIHRRLIESVYRAHLEALRARSAKVDAHCDVKVAEEQASQASTAHELAERRRSVAEEHLAFSQRSLGKCGTFPTQHQSQCWFENRVPDHPQSEQSREQLYNVNECSAAFIAANSTFSCHSMPTVPVGAQLLQLEAHPSRLKQSPSIAPPLNRSPTTSTTPQLSVFSPIVEGSSPTADGITKPLATERGNSTDQGSNLSAAPTSASNNTEATENSCCFRFCCVLDILKGIKRRANRDDFGNRGAFHMS